MHHSCARRRTQRGLTARVPTLQTTSDELYRAVQRHMRCATRARRHGRVKAALEEVALAFAARKCPGCGARGMKDDACTHMTCERCGA